MRRSIFLIAGGLALFAIILAAVVYTLAAIALPQRTSSAPALQGSTGPVGFGTTAQNNASASLESSGYQVDAIGNPNREDGSLDTSTVVVLMPLQSTQFDPDDRRVQDPGTKTQVMQGMEVSTRFFQDAVATAVGLQWGPYIVMFSAPTSDVRAIGQSPAAREVLWEQVRQSASVIDAVTWEAVYANAHLYKDFMRSEEQREAIPPAVLPQYDRQSGIRLQTSSAYLPLGEEAVLIATLTDSSGQPLAGRSLDFGYAAQGEEEQTIATTQTGQDGTARVRFRPTLTTGADLILSVSGATPAVAAAALMSVGSALEVTATTSRDAVVEDLRAQGINILGMDYDAGNPQDVPRTYAEIAAPRLDGSVRAQLLTLGGTLLTIYPQTESAEPVLVYRSNGRSFQLRFVLSRSDWQMWLEGVIGETQLWSRVQLKEVADAVTGQRVDRPDFITKDFGAFEAAIGIQVAKNLESRLVTESWGEQLYSVDFSVPLDGLAANFDVLEQTSGSDFAIYRVTDPVEPIYRASQDINGTALGQLQLSTGQYLMTVEGQIVPATVRLTYVELLVDSARVER